MSPYFAPYLIERVILLVSIKEGTLLYKADESLIQNSEIRRYQKWLSEKYEKHFDSYQDLWEWSTTEITEFWKSIWEFGEIVHSKSYDSILSGDKMPFFKWFENAHLNYVDQVFRHKDVQGPAIIYKTENKETQSLSWNQLYEDVATLANYMKKIGIKKGDRVVAYSPNIPETVVSFLACASIGAIWAIASPDFGLISVVDRFKQIEPKLLIAANGYQYNGNVYNKLHTIHDLLNEIPSIEHCIVIHNIGEKPEIQSPKMVHWNDALKDKTTDLKCEQVEFNHPLWILYSSGTTGLPKPIVHSHGGIIIEHIKILQIEGDIGKNDRFFWYTTTGWMMWNMLVSGLIVGSTIVLYDGSPSYPNFLTLWAFAEEVGITVFGTSAPFIASFMKYQLKPNSFYKFPNLRAVYSTGSPLSANSYKWIYDSVKNDILLISFSGGTDVCSGFVGGNITLPVKAGFLASRALGAKVESYDEEGNSIIGSVGELVVTKPMPSMPIYFWGDKDFRRYLESYFDTYPNVWKHGDWIQINEDGSSIIFGRSDATINRSGIRLGTSEIYKIVEAFPDILDSLVVDLEYKDRPSFLALFIVMQKPDKFSDVFKHKIKDAIKQNISPRFVPDEIYLIDEVPKTLNGKKLEVPIRKILLGMQEEKAINKDAMANPSSLDFFIELRKTLQQIK